MRKKFARYLRRKIKRAALTLVVLFIVVTIVGWPAVMTQPGVTRDWVGELNALRATYEPDGEDAWPIYRDVIVNDLGIDSVEDEDYSKLWHATDEIDNYKVYPRAFEHRWGDPIFDRHREVLASAQGVFNKLDRAAQLPRSSRPYTHAGSALEGEQDASAPTMGMYILMPELGALRRLSRMSSYRSRAAAAAQNWDEFVLSVDTALALAEHTGRAGMIIENLVGLSMAALSLEVVRHEVVEQSLPKDVCRSIGQSFAQRVHTRKWCAAALDVELLSVISTLETLYGTNGYSGAGLWVYDDDNRAFVETASLPRRLFNSFAVFTDTKQDCVDQFTENFRRIRPGLDVAPGELKTFLQRYEAGIEGDTPAATMVEILMPAVGRALRNNIMLERDVLATRLMLRLEAIHAETGAWPETLDAPELAELSTDPLTGHPFVYTLTPDDPHGRAYTLHAPHTPWENVGGEDFTETRQMFEPEEEDNFY